VQQAKPRERSQANIFPSALPGLACHEALPGKKGDVVSFPWHFFKPVVSKPTLPEKSYLRMGRS